jgi:putative phosphoesterase
MVNRVAVVSDIHGNILALEAVAADMQMRQVDAVLNLGDHVSGPLWPKETIGYLMQQDWIQISGNNDRQMVTDNPQNMGLSNRYANQALDNRERDWLRSLPAKIVFQGEISLCHGTPVSDMVYLLETIEHGRTRLAAHAEIGQRLGKIETGVWVCGHTHLPRVVQMPGDVLIVNPGSVGLPAYEDELPQYHVMETGSPHARYAILEHQNDHWTVDLAVVAYDYRKAAEQARKNNRPDWEIALLTGYMK